jgi:hypothetical protein
MRRAKQVRTTYTMKLPVLLSILVSLNGCAAMVAGSPQSLSVKAVSGQRDLPIARCTLLNDEGVWNVTAPGMVTVRRSNGDLNITCEADGYIPNAGSAPSGAKGLSFGNILFGGLLGVTNDYPSPIIVNLQPVRATVIQSAIIGN